MNTKRNVFSLHFHEASKNFRALVNGQVHPLLCGLRDIVDAEAAVLKLFSGFEGFDNVVCSDTFYDSEYPGSKDDMIRQLERAIAVLKGAPTDSIEQMSLEINIQFTHDSLARKYTSKE
jgi:hypothetical protein